MVSNIRMSQWPILLSYSSLWLLFISTKLSILQGKELETLNSANTLHSAIDNEPEGSSHLLVKTKKLSNNTCLVFRQT